MQKHANLVDLVKSFPTNILLQNLASIRKRTSPITFAHLAEKSEKGSISNLSTKAGTLKNYRGYTAHDLALEMQETCVDETKRKAISEMFEPLTLSRSKVTNDLVKATKALFSAMEERNTDRVADLLRCKADWAANKRFEISKFTFKFPRTRTYEMIGLVLGCTSSGARPQARASGGTCPYND